MILHSVDHIKLCSDKETVHTAFSCVSPIQVLVISQAKCHHLAANLMYLESFRWASSKNDNLG